MPKKLIGFLLLICLLVPLLGTYGILSYQRVRVRKSVKAKLISGIDRSELQVIKISNKEPSPLDWENDHEFRWDDHMYDVVEIQPSADSTTYICWLDHEETALSIRLETLLSEALATHPVRKDTHRHLILLLKTPFLLVEEVLMPLKSTKTERYLTYIRSIKPADYLPLTPPPWIS